MQWKYFYEILQKKKRKCEKGKKYERQRKWKENEKKRDKDREKKWTNSTQTFLSSNFKFSNYTSLFGKAHEMNLKIIFSWMKIVI